MHDLWERALQDLKGRLSPDNFETWLAPLTVEQAADRAANGDTRHDDLHSANTALVVRVRNKFFADWIQTHYMSLLLEALRKHGAPDSVRVEFAITETSSSRIARSTEPPPAPRPRISAPPPAMGGGGATSSGPSNTSSYPSASSVSVP